MQNVNSRWEKNCGHPLLGSLTGAAETCLEKVFAAFYSRQFQLSKCKSYRDASSRPVNSVAQFKSNFHKLLRVDWKLETHDNSVTKRAFLCVIGLVKREASNRGVIYGQFLVTRLEFSNLALLVDSYKGLNKLSKALAYLDISFLLLLATTTQLIIPSPLWGADKNACKSQLGIPFSILVM